MFETTNHLSNLDELENVSYDDILSAEQQAALEREYDSMVIRYNLDKMHKAEMYQRIEQTVISASDKLPPLIPVIRRKGVLICSEGNISAVVGEAKSKKTFLCTALVGSLLDMNKQNRFGIEPLFCKVLWVDTEQSREHIQKVLFRINLLGMIPHDNPNGRLLTQTLREESPAKRLEQLRYGIEYHQPKLVVVDGISDLMSNTNSLEESEALVAELLRLSSVYGCHIMNVLHTNPNSDKARGHLGSTLMRKAETVIFVHRAGEMSIVEPQYCRNMPFDRFAFAVENLPEVEQQSPACVGLGLPIECEVPNEQSEREDDCVRILRDDLGGCAERKLLCSMVAQKMGYTEVYSRVKVSRAIQRGLLHESSGKTVTVA
ncbi:MAG: AAA family ATPase [Tidjanibacter sp.]|nr:AAA family ATPase [Tidjanibacter sp.]